MLELQEAANIGTTIANVIQNNPEYAGPLLNPVCTETGQLIARLPRMLNACMAKAECWCINQETKIQEAKILAAKKSNISRIMR